MSQKPSSSRRHQTTARPTLAIIGSTQLYRALLLESLNAANTFQVTDWGEWDHSTMEQLVAHPPSVVLVDLPARGAKDFAQDARAHSCASPFVAINLPDDDAAILELLEAGFSGFVKRTASMGDVRLAVSRALEGEFHCPPKLAAALLLRLNALGSRTISKRGSGLSKREEQVLVLIDAGLSNKEIAARLSIEFSTVKNHVHNILKKTAVHARGEAVLRFRRDRTSE